MECIAVWNKCNNKCLMCSNPKDYDKWGDYSFEFLASRIKKISRTEKEIYLTGGEPTLHPRFFEILDFLRKKCPKAKIILDTNGRMFYYKDFLKKCLGCGNLEFQVSLCGHNAVLHDKITGIRGSFEQTIRGIKNLLIFSSSQNRTEIRVVIHKLTLPHLGEIYKFVYKNFPKIVKLIFIFMEFEGAAGKNRKIVGITYTRARPYLGKFFKKIKNCPFEVRFYHFPLCTLPAKFWPHLWRTLPEKEIAFLPSCSDCFYKKYCLGIHKEYLKYVGREEFRPIRENIELETTDDFYHPILAIK